ncbi:uncharacterized protein LOC126726035 isoform X5 [Quercus robur]|uniref:uncharacterized protein LOC126726035 isoform X5 n=1 Tax=Quercus robur TaxID=38942 RepID=UPI0021627F38|nr:uncharacterized protein LOC126726035 isoform X5 [Quercus robur]
MSCSKGNSSKLTRNVLIMVILGKFTKAISGRGPGSSTMCAIIHELYDECRNSTFNDCCDLYFEGYEECRDFKRGNSSKLTRNVLIMVILGKFTTAISGRGPGSSTMCAIIHELYDECRNSTYTDYCDLYFKGYEECRDFKRGNSSKLTRNVLIMVILGKFTTAISGRGPGSSTMCAIIHELYDECRNSTYTDYCDLYFKGYEECRDFKRDPKHQPLAELRKGWEKSFNDQGLADVQDNL